MGFSVHVLKITKIPLLLSLLYFWGILVKDKESCGGVGHGLDFGGWVGSDVLGLDWDKESPNFFLGLSYSALKSPVQKFLKK